MSVFSTHKDLVKAKASHGYSLHSVTKDFGISRKSITEFAENRNLNLHIYKGWSFYHFPVLQVTKTLRGLLRREIMKKN